MIKYSLIIGISLCSVHAATKMDCGQSPSIEGLQMASLRSSNDSSFLVYRFGVDSSEYDTDGAFKKRMIVLAVAKTKTQIAHESGLDQKRFTTKLVQPPMSDLIVKKSYAGKKKYHHWSIASEWQQYRGPHDGDLGFAVLCQTAITEAKGRFYAVAECRAAAPPAFLKTLDSVSKNFFEKSLDLAK